MRRVAVAATTFVLCALPAVRAGAVDMHGGSGGSGGAGEIHVDIDPSTGPSRERGSGAQPISAGAGGRDSVSGSGGGSGGSRPSHPGLTLAECVAFLERTEDRDACVPATPSPPPEPGAPPTRSARDAPTIDAGVVAERVRESMPVHLPAVHTSPPADGFQLVGLQTWYWLDPDGWAPTSVRAEVADAWIEVTATPTVARWTPGDGAGVVTCDGPGRRHPGTAGARTDCGHTYVEVGAVEIDVAVVYGIAWTASTGETGTLAPLVLDTSVTIEIQQRQAVTD